MSTQSSWEFDTDPNGIIPVGFIFDGNVRVVGFCSPMEPGIRKMMVQIAHPNYTGDKSTTIGYMTELRKYILSLSHMEFVNKFV
jgi:hypothetical protein